MHLTQSAISHQLKEIEDRLGAPLFQRMRHDMVLTPAGKRVLDSAALVLDELKRAEEAVAEMAGRQGGTVRLSTQCYTAYHWLPQLMKTFNAKHPHVSVHINVDATYRAVDALLEGTLDLALTNDKRSHERLRFVPVFGDELIALMPSTHPLAAREHLRPRDFQDQTLVLPSDLKDSLSEPNISRTGGGCAGTVTQDSTHGSDCRNGEGGDGHRGGGAMDNPALPEGLGTARGDARQAWPLSRVVGGSFESPENATVSDRLH